ncbi:MAG: ATP-binding cassette domain-containing protein, partial [Clostridia bacterium]|nr:ATP-binding cassette domain-containing protein [Clostridia bacterium]
VRGLTFAYPGAAPLLSDLSFDVRRGERVLLLGGNGVGKSTLMRLLCGRLPPARGFVEFGYRVSVGYYDQQISGLDPARTVWEEMRAAFPDRTDRELRSALALFLFGADGITQTVGSLSGGERARQLLCKLMQKKVNLLLLDEPTNHLDIASKEALEEALGDYDGTVVAVSHDRYFIDRVASRVIELDPAADGGLIDCPLEEEEGAWSVYTRLRDARREREDEAAAPKEDTDAKRRYQEQKRERAKRSSAAHREQKARERADELEKEIEQIDRRLDDPALASDYVRLSELTRRKEEAEEELLALYEELL